MQTQLLRLIFIGFSITSIAFLLFKMYHKLEEKRAAEANTALLPSFTFYNQNGSLFQADSISYHNEKIVIGFFSPDCEHCQYMAGKIKMHNTNFAGIPILMITQADSLAVSQFATKYKLVNEPGIIFLRDPNYTFNQVFGPSIVPSFYLYKNRALIRKIVGETKIENLIIF